VIERRALERDKTDQMIRHYVQWC